MRTHRRGDCREDQGYLLRRHENQGEGEIKEEKLEKVKVGVIGVGYLGRHHARIYSELDNSRLVGVSDTDEERGRAVARDYGTEFVSRPRDLLERVEAISIAVPASSHYRLSRDAMSAGTHTLVEKPITCTVEEADSLVGLAQKNNVKLFVGHTERFSSPMVAVKQRIKHPLFVESHRLTCFGDRGIDVDVVLDLMIHDIDMVLWLAQSKLLMVDAVGVPVLTEHEDIANARMEFANGCVANLTVSRVSKEPLRKTRVFQKDEYISIDSSGSSVEICSRFSGKSDRPSIKREQFVIDGDEPLRAELEAFLFEVSGQRRTVLATGREGREALSVALMILTQMRERRARLESD